MNEKTMSVENEIKTLCEIVARFVDMPHAAQMRTIEFLSSKVKEQLDAEIRELEVRRAK